MCKGNRQLIISSIQITIDCMRIWWPRISNGTFYTSNKTHWILVNDTANFFGLKGKLSDTISLCNESVRSWITRKRILIFIEYCRYFVRYIHHGKFSVGISHKVKGCITLSVSSWRDSSKVWHFRFNLNSSFYKSIRATHCRNLSVLLPKLIQFN